MKRDRDTYLIKDVIEKYLRDNKNIGINVKLQNALKLWTEISDDYTKNHTKAVLVKNKLLFVNTDSTVLSNELALRETELLSKLNKKLRANAIKRIVFKSGITRKEKDITIDSIDTERNISLKEIKHAEAIVKSIKDDELKQSLKRLILTSIRRDLSNR